MPLEQLKLSSTHIFIHFGPGHSYEILVVRLHLLLNYQIQLAFCYIYFSIYWARIGILLNNVCVLGHNNLL